MNFNSKQTKLFLIKSFLFILIFNWLKIATATDSLKIYYYFSSPKDSSSVKISKQLLADLQQSSSISLSEKKFDYSIKGGIITVDSTILKALRNEKADGVIVGEFARINRIDEINLWAFNFNTRTKFSIKKGISNSSNIDLNSVRASLEKFLFKSSGNDIATIILLPTKSDKIDNDSEIASQLNDSLSAHLQNWKIRAFVTIDNSNIKTGIDLLSYKSQNKLVENSANLILLYTVEKAENGEFIFRSHILLNSAMNTQNQNFLDVESYMGKTSQLNEFNLSPFKLNQVHEVVNFLKGIITYQQNDYNEAVLLFKKMESLPASFYAGECYLKQAIERKNDLEIARTLCDTSIQFFQAALNYSKSSADSAFIFNNTGIAYQICGKLDSSKKYLQLAYNRTNSLTDHYEKIRIASNYGNTFLLNGKWTQALSIFESNVNDMKAVNDSINLAITYENLGNIYQLIMQRNKAMDYYRLALDLRKQMNDDMGMANVMQYIGVVHQEKKEYDKAINYYKDALSINNKIHNEPKIAESLDNIGQVFQNLNQADSAIAYFQKAIDVFAAMDNNKEMIKSMLHQASAFQKQKLFEEALAIYEQALLNSEKLQVKTIRAQILDRMGDVYNTRGDAISAYDHYQQSADIYRTTGNFESLSLILYNMGLIRLKENDYNEGYHLLKKAVELDIKYGYNNLTKEQNFIKELEVILGDSLTN